MGFTRVTIILLLSTAATTKSLENNTYFNDDTDYRSNLEEKERVDLSRLCNELSTFIPDACSYKFVQDKCKRICCKKTVSGKTIHEVRNSAVLQCGVKIPPEPSKKKRSMDSLDTEEMQGIKRIINGKLSKKGEWPWQVRIAATGLGDGKRFCGAAILSSYFVLTASHCFDTECDDLEFACGYWKHLCQVKGPTGDYLRKKCPVTCNTCDRIYSREISKWNVYVGEHNQAKNEDDEVIHKIKKLIRHENYVEWSEYPDTDIALLQLEKPIKFSGATSARSCLPDNNHKVSPTQKCYVVGWGYVDEDKTKEADVLRYSSVLLVPKRTCNLWGAHRGKVGKAQMCAGSAEKKGVACLGDSGGALNCRVNNLWYTTGIVNGSVKCGALNKFGIYANDTYFKEWIIKAILEKTDLL